MKRVVFAGDRLFKKFPNRDYFCRRISEIGAEWHFAEGADDAALTEATREAAAVVVIDRRIDRSLIEEMQRCELVMTLSVGYDCVDVAAATARRIPVSNCPTYCIDEVAGHAITLLHAVARKLHLVIPQTRAGNWYTDYAKPIFSFQQKLLGIIGLGRIGRATAARAQALGMRVAAYDPYVDDDIFALCGVRRFLDLEEMLPECDSVSIHAPLNGETLHMINRETLSLMQPHACLINTARGAIIDEAALLAALQDGRIAAAGLDVLEKEPPAADHPLLHEERVLVTPHMAWYSEESYTRNQELGMDELIRVLTGRRPQYVVNPQVFEKSRFERTTGREE